MIGLIGIFVAVVLGALAIDGGLHWAGRPEWGRQLGYLGTALIAASFLHSARKRRAITFGRAAQFLRAHEVLAWLGAMLVLVHGGIHFNALLPWLAMGAMLVTVASGLAGKSLLRRSRAAVARKRQALLDEGLPPDELEERLYWDALVVDVMRRWRVVHLPITAVFAFLALLHVATMLIFWRW